MASKKGNKNKNGKGDRPRNNSSKEFSSRYDKIDWSNKKKSNKKKMI
tara:strand:+ start:563 stop:703 length:141 start_codon:yes stop_codon:yes gene_type:complete